MLTETQPHAAPLKSRITKTLAYLAISLVSCLVFTVVWDALRMWAFPETATAYRPSPFRGPLTFPVITMTAVFSALLVWPFYTVLGWRHPPRLFGATAGAVTLAYIVLVTPIDARLAHLGSHLVLITMMIVCRLVLKESGRPRPQSDGGSAHGPTTAAP